MAVVTSLLVGACSLTEQSYYDINLTPVSLTQPELEAHGLGFLTPAAPTGLETDKQSLALVFSETLSRLRPEIEVVTLPEILSAVNSAGMAEDYKLMYRDYLETGILERCILSRISEESGTRYLAQMSLASFDQFTRGRFGILGLRMVDTKQASLRVFLQIWDAKTGEITWEGSQEINFAYDTGSERPVSFNDIAAIAAENLLSELPGGNGNGRKTG